MLLSAPNMSGLIFMQNAEKGATEEDGFYAFMHWLLGNILTTHSYSGNACCIMYSIYYHLKNEYVKPR